MPVAFPQFDEPSGVFGIELKFTPGKDDPTHVFQVMNELIGTIFELDRYLAYIVDERIEPVLVLEDIQPGSIRTWIRDRLSEVADDDLQNLNWKRIVGSYLVKAKARFLGHISQRDTFSTRDDLRSIESEISELARSTGVKEIESYARVSPYRLISAYQRISTTLTLLNENDTVTYMSMEDSVVINRGFTIPQETADTIMTFEKTRNENPMVLKVKKPDYLGFSMWEFRHGSQVIHARIVHNEWLEKFHNRLVTVRPGDSIRAIVAITITYDDSHELVSEHYEVVEVLEILEMPPGMRTEEQLELLTPKRKLPRHYDFQVTTADLPAYRGLA